MYGYGDIVRIDLTSGSVDREPIAPGLAKRFLGGMGINDWLLWEHFLKVDPHIDPSRSTATRGAARMTVGLFR